MKNTFTILLASFTLTLQAQYTPFFDEDFESNKNNWFVGEIKKSSVDISKSEYNVYNDWGKNPVISLIDLPFNENKNYKIESEMEPGYIPHEDGGGYGIMFAAKDEKNGYAVLLDSWRKFRFVRIDNGKITELHYAVSGKINPSQSDQKDNVITIFLEDWRWKIMVNDTTLYSGASLPWLGHKVGFYVSDQAGYSASNLTILEAIPGPSPCPFPFTQEQLNEQLGKIICAAPDDFASMLGGLRSESDGLEIWNVKDVSIEGAIDIFLAKGGIAQSAKKGKDLIITFSCSDLNDRDVGLAFFHQFMKAINQVKPPCGTLKQREPKENLADFLVKSVIWDIEIKTPASGTSKVIVELDLNKFESGYYNNVHVNVQK